MPFHAMKNLLYNLSCNVPYLQQNNPATNQNQRQPSTSSYVHASNNILQLQKQKFNNLIHKIFFIDTIQLTHRYVIPTGLIAPMTDLQPSNFVCQKNSYRQFQYRLPELVYETGRAQPEPPQPIANIWARQFSLHLTIKFLVIILLSYSPETTLSTFSRQLLTDIYRITNQHIYRIVSRHKTHLFALIIPLSSMIFFTQQSC